MNLDWTTIDRWLLGEAWTGSQIRPHLTTLCETIGPRWASSEAERQVIHYIREQFQQAGLDPVEIEPFELATWFWQTATARLLPEGHPIDILPFLRCPPFQIQAPLVDVGFGTPHELERAGARLAGAIAVMNLAFEPFSPPIPHTQRLAHLARAGAAAAVVVERKSGRRMEYHSAGEWRDPGPDEHPLPTVVTSREDGALLRRAATAGKTLQLVVEAQFQQAPTANVRGEIAGTRWPEEHLLLGGHHDTVFDAPGGNDNASGAIAVLETARVLARLRVEMGIAPGRTIRFVTFSAEEQTLQGSTAYVARHHGDEPFPRLAINLDELSTGYMKGIVLGFPHLRDFVQQHLDTMNDGLQCHVMAQLDASSDHFPFLRRGIDAAFLWRWRFFGRHPDSDFHHEPGDTADKVNIRELKEYVGQLARILLRLSHTPPADWPANPVTPAEVQQRIQAERGTVVRVF